MQQEPHSEDITMLLGRIGQGDKQAEARLVPLLYDELHRLAQNRLHGERQDLSLRPTELVNEAYLKLIAKPGQTYLNRSHFFATAARAMRNILVDHIRGKRADKRGGELIRVEFDERIVFTPEKSDQLLALHDALERLETLDPQLARIVELRYFGGFQMQQVCELLGLSERTGRREWEYARKWLYAEISRVAPNGS